jgi:hypothetical protein
MGSKQSQFDPTVAAVSTTAPPPNDDNDDDGNTIYYLKKKRPGCTGMFWRSDPTGQVKLASNDHWPRDNAMLKGKVVVTSGGEQWLLATQVRQAKDSSWHTAPIGAAMPFAYDNHYFLDTQAPK